MSKKDAVVVASRALAMLLTMWALSEVSYLPEFLHSYRHYAYEAAVTTAYVDYMRHYYLLRLGFLVTRIIGLFLIARWLYKTGPGVEQLLLPHEVEDGTPGT